MAALASPTDSRAAQPLLPPRLPGPLFFFQGLDEPASAIPIAKRLGLNAIQIRIQPGEDLGDKLKSARQLISQARAAGLRVVVQLATNLGLEQRITPSDADYWRQCRAFITQTVSALADLPIDAWQTDDFLEKAIRYDDAHFRRFLLSRYGRPEAAAKAWGVEAVDLAGITQKRAEQLDDDQPYSVGRPSVDVADFRAWAFSEIMRRWAELIWAADPNPRPIITGRLSLYRSFLCVPDCYAALVPAIRPDVFEPDPVAGLIHAVDMARRSGKFDVIPSIYMPLPGSPLYNRETLRRWILLAAAHGARGFALEDWQRFVTIRPDSISPPQPRDQKLIAVQLRNLELWLEGLTRPDLFTIRARPTYAFIWSPYAGGFEVFGVPTYGFLRGLSETEPSRLFFAFRRGCRFGTADFLGPADVALADLDRYGAIFAPLALSLDDPARNALEAWAADGGLLVADIGLGMAQASWKHIPPPLQALTGVASIDRFVPTVADFQVCALSDLLPLPLNARSAGLPAHVQGAAPATARAARAIRGLAGYFDPLPGTQLLAIASTLPKAPGAGRVVCGIAASKHLSGGGVFASFPLWANWRTDGPLFAAFHSAACCRRASYCLLGGFWPGPADLVPTDRGCVLASVSKRTELIECVALGAGDQLHAGAVCETSAQWRMPDGSRTGDVRMLVALPPLSLVRLERRPVAVRPYEESCTARILAYGPRMATIRIYGSKPRIRLHRGRLRIQRGGPCRARVIISDGTYPVRPASRHAVRIQSDAGKRQLTVVADTAGRIEFDVAGRDLTITIAPAPAGAAVGR